jgi:Fic family protein
LIVSNDTIMNNPPYTITDNILSLVVDISEKIGEINSAHLQKPSPELRKKNRVRTIQSSLQIEGNSLSENQVTALLENKRVLGPEKDITEVQNAIRAYDAFGTFKAADLRSFCKAHGLLTKGLVDLPGKLRTKNVGIMKGKKLAHLAPPAAQVKPLLNDLFAWLKSSREPALIKSCVFHYEIEFIHPFTDGNGRIGRLWQTVILKEKYPVFEFLPVETIIREKQRNYYDALSRSDKAGSSTFFIEFMLGVINEALERLLRSQQVALTSENRIGLIPELFGKNSFSRQDYMRRFKEISSATASRDLKLAADSGILKKTGDKKTTTYFVVPKKK